MTDDMHDLLHRTADAINADPDPEGLRSRLQRADRRSHAARVGAAIGTVSLGGLLVAVLASSRWAGSPTIHRIASQPATSSTATPITTPTSVPPIPATVPSVAPSPTSRKPTGLAPTTFAHCTSNQQNATGTGDPTPAGFQGTGLAGNPVHVASQYGQAYAVIDPTGHWAATAQLAHLPYRKTILIKVECADRTSQTYNFTRTG